MEAWYFAYGSNLWIDQMIARTGAIGHAERPSRIARLPNYRLVFQTLSDGGSAFANILCPGEGVLGVVYRCSAMDLEKLDRFEGGYKRQPITVTDQQGETLSAVAYVIRPARGVNPGRPSAEYLERIVTGARQHHFPQSYVDDVLSIAAAGTSPDDHSDKLNA